jgi:phosphoribosylglycinamide formyltransferase 1
VTSPLIARAPTPADDPLRIAVLVSGSGSNLQALLDQAKAYKVVVVVSNVDGVFALERAKKAGVEAVVESHKGRSREAFEDAIQAHLDRARAELVVLAGFMRVLTPHFLSRWERRVVNVHPALCPAFPGMHAPRQALRHGVRVTGCTVHLVDAGVDTGPILAQQPVPIADDDSEETLTKRIQAEEHKLLPSVVNAIARGEVLVDGNRIRWR